MCRAGGRRVSGCKWGPVRGCNQGETRVHQVWEENRETETERHREMGKEQGLGGGSREESWGPGGAGGGCCACLPSSETHQGKSTGIYSGNHRLLALLFYHFADAITEPYPLSGKLEMSFPE